MKRARVMSAPSVVHFPAHLVGPVGDKGGQGNIHLYRILGNEYVRKSALDPRKAAQLRMRKEIEAFKELDNDHIAKIEHIEQCEDGLVYYTRYCPEGSLYAFLEKNSVSTEEALVYMRQLLTGLGEMHDNDLIHRDLKPQNILMQNDMHLLITDLGLVYKQDGHSTITGVGTPGWIAPELQRSGVKPSPASDIYSLGLVFLHILKNTSDKTYLQQVLEDRLIPAMTHPDPDKRLDSCNDVEDFIDELVNHAETAVLQHQQRLQQRQADLLAGRYPYPGAYRHF